MDREDVRDLKVIGEPGSEFLDATRLNVQQLRIENADVIEKPVPCQTGEDKRAKLRVFADIDSLPSILREIFSIGAEDDRRNTLRMKMLSEAECVARTASRLKTARKQDDGGKFVLHERRELLLSESDGRLQEFADDDCLSYVLSIVEDGTNRGGCGRLGASTGGLCRCGLSRPEMRGDFCRDVILQIPVDLFGNGITGKRLLGFCDDMTPQIGFDGNVTPADRFSERFSGSFGGWFSCGLLFPGFLLLLLLCSLILPRSDLRGCSSRLNWGGRRLARCVLRSLRRRLLLAILFLLFSNHFFEQFDSFLKLVLGRASGIAHALLRRSIPLIASSEELGNSGEDKDNEKDHGNYAPRIDSEQRGGDKECLHVRDLD